MPSYKYTARDMDGRLHTGVIVAPTDRDARKMLRNRELYTTELREEVHGLLRSLARIVKPAA